MAPAEFVQVVQASVGRHVHQLPFLWQTTSGSKCLVKLHTLWSESEWAGVTRVIWTKKDCDCIHSLCPWDLSLFKLNKCVYSGRPALGPFKCLLFLSPTASLLCSILESTIPTSKAKQEVFWGFFFAFPTCQKVKKKLLKTAANKPSLSIPGFVFTC